jgi:hypothetical protein
MLVSKIDTTYPTLQESSRPNRKSIRQKRDRRKAGLMKKASEYSKMCGADVCLGIRIRDTGRVYMFSADASGFWEFVGSHLVSLPRFVISLQSADSPRVRIIQPQVRSLTRTLASREINSYLPLNRGGTGTTDAPWDFSSNQPTNPQKWPHRLPESFVYIQRETTKVGQQSETQS